MKGDNPPHKYVQLYCQPPQTQINSEDDLDWFPPIRERNRTSLASPNSVHPPCTQADDSESELSDFPPIKKRNSTASPIPARSCPPHPQAARRGSSQISSPSKEESPQSQRHQEPNVGLGQTNILNMVDAAQQAKVTRYTFFAGSLAYYKCKLQSVHFPRAKSLFKRDFEIQDVADERTLKKQRLASRSEDDMRRMQREIAGIKEGLEKVAAEARKDRRDICALQRLLRQKP